MAYIRITELEPGTRLQDTDVLHGVQSRDGRDKKISLQSVKVYLQGGESDQMGTVTEVRTGTGLLGGPITRTGTISLDINRVATQSSNGLMSLGDKQKLDAATPSADANKLCLRDSSGGLSLETLTAQTIALGHLPRLL